MGYLVRLIVFALIFSGLTAGARANEAAPPPRAPIPENERPKAEAKRTPLVVMVEPGKPARSIIPRSLVAGLAAEGSADVGARPRSATIASGVALSMAAVSLMFVFRRSRRAATLVAVLLLATTSSLVFADIAPIRGRPKGKTPEATPAIAERKLDIQVEIVEKGDAIQLIIDQPQRLTPTVEPRPTGSRPPSNGRAPNAPNPSPPQSSAPTAEPQ